MRAYRKVDIQIGLVSLKAKIYTGVSGACEGPVLEQLTETGSRPRWVCLDPVQGEVPRTDLVPHYRVKRGKKQSDLVVPVPREELDACGVEKSSVLHFNRDIEPQEIPAHARKKTYLIAFDDAQSAHRDSLHRSLRYSGKMLVARGLVHSNTRRPRLYGLEAREEDFVLVEFEHQEYWNESPQKVGDEGHELDDMMAVALGAMNHGLPKDEYAPAVHALVESKLTDGEKESVKMAMAEFKNMLKEVS